MNSNKPNKNKREKDLKFTPMNVQDSLKPVNFPTPNINGGPMGNGIMYMCFPAPSINMMNPAVTTDNKANIAPLTPYPSNISDIEKTQTSPYQPKNNNNNNLNTNPNKNNINTNFNNNLNSNNNNVPSSFPSQSTDLEYPSELNSDDLYSYNKPRMNDNYDESIINPLDILRNFSFDDIQLSDSFRNDNKENYIDEIFKKIEDNNSVVLATMKAYRIPYPIAKLLIKNIIKLTLEYKGR